MRAPKQAQGQQDLVSDVMEKVIFPIQYKDLSPNALVAITIYDLTKPYKESLVGSTTIDLFDSKFRLRQGHLALKVWRN